MFTSTTNACLSKSLNKCYIADTSLHVNPLLTFKKMSNIVES